MNKINTLVRVSCLMVSPLAAGKHDRATRHCKYGYCYCQNSCQCSVTCTCRRVGGQVPKETIWQTTIRRNQVDYLQVWLKAGKLNPDTTTGDPEGYTLLHLAAKLGQGGIVELLLEYNADPNSVDGNGETPLDLAVAAGNEEIALQLHRVGGQQSAGQASSASSSAQTSEAVPDLLDQRG